MEAGLEVARRDESKMSNDRSNRRIREQAGVARREGCRPACVSEIFGCCISFDVRVPFDDQDGGGNGGAVTGGTRREGAKSMRDKGIEKI